MSWSEFAAGTLQAQLGHLGVESERLNLAETRVRSVPGEGLEPSRRKPSQDFKSCAFFVMANGLSDGGAWALIGRFLHQNRPSTDPSSSVKSKTLAERESQVGDLLSARKTPRKSYPLKILLLRDLGI